MPVALVYLVYLVAAIGAVCVYVGLPRDGRPLRRGLFTLCMAAGAGAAVLIFSRLFEEAGRLIGFVVPALLSLGCAVRVVTHPKPVYCAVYFVMVVLSTAALCVQAGAEFLGFALIIVYAGAILVTYAFVIMLSQQPGGAGDEGFAEWLDYDRNAREPAWAVLAGFLLTGVIGRTVVEADWAPLESHAERLSENNVLNLGRLLMTDFAISVELAALLLTVAMVGAIAVARRRLVSLEPGREDYRPGQAGREVEPF